MGAAVVERVAVSAPNFKVAEFVLRGTAPYMQARFGAKAQQAMAAKMKKGSLATKEAKPKRAPRDFAADLQQAIHRSTEGWVGVPAPALRNACIDVCRLVGFTMKLAKMSVFIESDGFDAIDGTPLVRLLAGEPEQTEMMVRNATGVADIRVRPIWREWSLKVRVRFDADQFSFTDVANLLARAGQQVGIGEGRPFSKQSNGLGFGLFELA